MPLALEAEDQVQDPNRLTAPEWAEETLGTFLPVPLILEGPSLLASLVLISPPSYVPKTHTAGGGPRSQGTRPGSPTGFPAEWVGETPSMPPLIL